MEDTLEILKGIAHYYESFHGVKIPEGILRQAVKLSERYITDRFLPDKAIDLIDEACSDMNLHDKNINRRMELRTRPRKRHLRARDAHVRRARGRQGADRGAARRALCPYRGAAQSGDADSG